MYWHITPSTEGLLALKQKLEDVIREYVSAPMPALIKKLNQMLRGWGNYHRHVVASEAFYWVDTYVYEQLWRMLRVSVRSHHVPDTAQIEGSFVCSPLEAGDKGGKRCRSEGRRGYGK